MKKMLLLSSRLFQLLLIILLLFLIADFIVPLENPYAQDQSGKFSRVVVADDGTPLRAFADKNGVWRYPVTIDDVSPRYIDTLLAYEDRWFWLHPGVNPFSIVRAAGQNLINGRIISGGSTISMQVARILYPHSRTIAGKLKQIFRTFQLEWHYSKVDILTFYLNLAPFGGPLEGIQAASFAYLGKSAKELSLAEAALLSVLPQSPSRFRPDRHPQRATRARNKVLERLQGFAMISAEQVSDAQLEIVMPQFEAHPMTAPVFARRINNRIKNKSVNEQQAIIRTTIDSHLQINLEALVKDYSRQLPQKSSAAILVVNHHTMAVKAYVASADFYDQQSYGQVDMIRAVRSPGSTLKPFLYAMALDQGLISSHSMLMDEEMNIAGYKPKNFTNDFSGTVSMSEALQRSLNIPAVQVLQFLGPVFFHSKLENAGLKLHMPASSPPGLAMILGGTGTRLEELVSAYTAFSRHGKAGQLRFIMNSDLQEKYLISEGAAWIIRDILSKMPIQHSYSGMIRKNSASRNSLQAWKTGTSYGFRDAWAIGMTADYTIGIWTGRPDGTPVPGHYGAQTAVPLLKAVSQNLPHTRSQNLLENKVNTRPESVTQEVICWPGGELQSRTKAHECKKTQLSWILDNTIPPVLAANPLLATAFNELKIISIDNNSHIKRPDGSDAPLSVNLQAQGGTGGLFWFIDGVPVNKKASRAVISYTFLKEGKHQISAIDSTGQSHQISLYVL